MSARLRGKTLLVCVGAQKAGTTWLYTNLRRHPEVFLPPTKELHWFSGTALEQQARLERYLRRLQRAAAALSVESEPAAMAELAAYADYFRLIRGDLSYLDFFARNVSAEQQRIFGDFTPAYAVMDVAKLQMLRDAWPDIKLLFVMREPVHRLISAVKMMSANAGRVASDADVAAALDDPKVMAYSRYDWTWEKLLSVFDRGDIEPVFYETMFGDAFAPRLCEWLGVAPAAFDAAERVNASRDAYAIEGPGLAHARARLQPVYEYCARAFGDLAPACWREQA